MTNMVEPGLQQQPPNVLCFGTTKHRQKLYRWSNVATIHLASGYTKFHSYCTITNSDAYKENPLTRMEVDTSLISDSEDEESEPPTKEYEGRMDVDDQEWSPLTTMPPPPTKYNKEDTPLISDQPTKFNIDGPMQTKGTLPNIIEDEEERINETATAELLRRHHEMGHISFRKLQEMARQGVLP